jgi:2-amino-4-hydroxy-6-hydroxymethyldihydropteridine diphosphokinase
MSDESLNLAYLCLGSNISPETNLPAAIPLLNKYGRIVAVSKVWETPPCDGANQPNYLNCAVLLQTQLDATALRLNAIAAVENALHRVRNADDAYTARTIDVDIALFNRDILRIEHRKIPDPDILTRPFVAVPLAELTPDYVHPENYQTLQVIAQECLSRSAPMVLRSDVDLGGYARSLRGK